MVSSINSTSLHHSSSHHTPSKKVDSTILLGKSAKHAPTSTSTDAKVKKVSSGCFAKFCKKLGSFFKMIGRGIKRIFCSSDEAPSVVIDSISSSTTPSIKKPPQKKPPKKDPTVNPEKDPTKSPSVHSSSTTSESIHPPGGDAKSKTKTPSVKKSPKVSLTESQKKALELEEEKKKAAAEKQKIKELREKTVAEGMEYLDQFAKTFSPTNVTGEVKGLPNITSANCYMNAALQALAIQFENDANFQYLMHMNLERKLGESLPDFEKRVMSDWAPLMKEPLETDESFENRILFKRSFLALMRAKSFGDEAIIETALREHHAICFGLRLSSDFYTGQASQKDSSDYLRMWYQSLQWVPLTYCTQNYTNYKGTKVSNPPKFDPLSFLLVDIPKIEVPADAQQEINEKVEQLDALKKEEIKVHKEEASEKIKELEAKIEEQGKIVIKLKEEADAKAKAEEAAKAAGLPVVTTPAAAPAIPQADDDSVPQVLDTAQSSSALGQQILKGIQARRGLRRLGRKDKADAKKDTAVSAAEKVLASMQKELKTFKSQATSKENALERAAFYERIKLEQKAKDAVVLPGEELLKGLFVEEMLQDVEYETDDGLIKVDFSFRENKLGACLPPAFTMQLKRFYNDAYGSRGKISNKIDFEDLKVIDINKYVINADPTVEILYQLNGIIVHSGSMRDGHYVCYSKKEGQWHLCNDGVVTKVEEDAVPFEEAYICSYEKV